MADKNGVRAILNVIAHWRQNVVDEVKLDVWLAGFLAKVGEAQGVSGQDMALELSRYLDLQGAYK